MRTTAKAQDLSALNTGNLCVLLKELGLRYCVDIFKTEEIDGAELIEFEKSNFVKWLIGKGTTPTPPPSRPSHTYAYTHTHTPWCACVNAILPPVQECVKLEQKRRGPGFRSSCPSERLPLRPPSLGRKQSTPRCWCTISRPHRYRSRTWARRL